MIYIKGSEAEEAEMRQKLKGANKIINRNIANGIFKPSSIGSL